MFDSIASVFSRKNRTSDFNGLPSSVRDEIMDAMSATSKTDIR